MLNYLDAPMPRDGSYHIESIGCALEQNLNKQTLVLDIYKNKINRYVLEAILCATQGNISGIFLGNADNGSPRVY